METKNSTYLILTIILVILSIVGIIFLINLPKTNSSSTSNSSASKIELIPTDSPREEVEVIITPTVAIASSSVTKTTPTPIANPTSKLKTTPTPVLTTTPTPISSSNPTTLDFSASADGFSVSYNSSRKVYQDKETSGNRYTFYNIAGNFAIHVGLDGKWSWTNPNRKFTEELTVSGKPTFRYDISTQTIIDLQSDDKNYTIQCVHNGKESLKTECESFYRSFKLL